MPAKPLDITALRNRLVIATNMWRETTDEPLPKLPPGEPVVQIEQFEVRLVEMMCNEARSETAKEIADKTWDLVHDRPESDPVKQRVIECHEVLARLSRGPGRDGD